MYFPTTRTRALTDRDGLHQNLSTRIPRPAVKTAADVAALNANERNAYNDSRIRFLSGGLDVTTPQVRTVIDNVETIHAGNSACIGTQNGLLLSGEAGSGKTTTAKMLMKHVFREYGTSFPDFADHGHTPVVFIEVPAGSTPKLMMTHFAQFFGLAIARAETMASIQHRVVATLNAANTQLIVVDELQNLIASNRGNGESIDVLRSLHNQVPATFVYSGVELLKSELLSGPRGQQLSARCIPMELTRYNVRNAAQQTQWDGLIGTFEKALPLNAQEPDSLRLLADALAMKANGSLGTLRQILAGAAIDLIRNPAGRPERITAELIDAKAVDLAAQKALETARALHRTSKSAKKAA